LMGRGWKRIALDADTAPVPYPTTVLQVDQAAPAHQGLLWNQRKRRQNPALDRHLGLPAGRHRQKTTRSSRIALHFASNPLSYHVRENAHFTGTSAEGIHRSTTNWLQTDDSVRVLTGQL